MSEKFFPCPALGFRTQSWSEVYFPHKNLPVAYLRSLTIGEIEMLEKTKTEVVSAINHFRLFRLFRKNYSELIRAVTSSLTVGEMEEDEKLELDRTLLNLLSVGKAITDHFAKYFSSKFKNSPEGTDFKKYLSRLRSQSWGYALAEDVRNYVQHQGLPILDYNRKFSATSVRIELTLNAGTTFKNARDWPYSKLTPDRGKIDFFEIIQEYYLRVTRDLLTFLAKWLSPHYMEAHEFLAGLTGEVKAANPKGRLVILTKFESKGNDHSFSFVEPPEDVLLELGLREMIPAAIG